MNIEIKEGERSGLMLAQAIINNYSLTVDKNDKIVIGDYTFKDIDFKICSLLLKSLIENNIIEVGNYSH